MSRPALSLVPTRDPSNCLTSRPKRPRSRSPLDEAGIADLRYPITVHLADGSQQPTVATRLVRGERRRRHSRRPHEPLRRELCTTGANRIGVSTLSASARRTARATRRRLGRCAKFDFPLFLERTGPVSGGSALVAYDCSLEGSPRCRAKHGARSRRASRSRASAPAVARSATTAHTTSAAASRSASAST